MIFCAAKKKTYERLQKNARLMFSNNLCRNCVERNKFKYGNSLTLFQHYAVVLGLPVNSTLYRYLLYMCTNETAMHQPKAVYCVHYSIVTVYTNLLKLSRRKNIFSYFVSLVCCLTWGLKRGLASNKSTHYLLYCDDFKFCSVERILLC